ncbi:MAG: hypothetical protein WC623_06730 [Pedobacter sp.]|uniref:hypothetical protein n=1 Tax=Pedobacter sp. TaxID=1411316 RepID=UPI003567A79B
MTTIQNIVFNNGPMISSDLVKLLAAQENISENTASKRIERETELQKISGFFQSNQSLVYLSEQQEEGEILDLLTLQMEKHGRKYWYIINALKYHMGTMSRDFLETYSNYPIEPLVSHIPFNEVMQKFVKENILVFNNDGYSFSPKFRFKGSNPFLSQTLEVIKRNVLENYSSQMKNIGMVSYGSAELFAEYGKFRWAFKGVSPIKGLMNGGDFGFVLGDIILGRPTYTRDIEFFIKKIDTIQRFKNASRIIPVLLVDSIDKVAFNLLKEKGIVIGVIKEIFGEKYAATLNDLITILTNAAASLANNPNHYLELIAELRKYNNGLLNNIKGALFEYVAGQYFIHYHAALQMGWDIYDESGKHEMDILATFGGKVVVAECKGRIAPTSIDAINLFLSKKVPAFKKWVGKQELLKNKEIEFEFWSSSGFTPDAITKIEDIKVNYTKYKVIFLGQKEIMSRAKEMKNKKLQDTLNSFFFKTHV